MHVFVYNSVVLLRL